MADLAITETLTRDPDRVLRAVIAVFERFKSERGYTLEEIDAIATELCRDLGIPWNRRVTRALPLLGPVRAACFVRNATAHQRPARPGWRLWVE